MKFQIKNNWFWYSKPNETNRSYRYHHICKCTKVPTNGQMYCIFFNDSLLTAFAACVCVGGGGRGAPQLPTIYK